MNNSAGPALRSIPNENTAGIMENAARTAPIVLKSMIVRADFGISVFSSI